MSKSANEKLCFLETLAHRVRGVTLTYSGVALQRSDSDTVYEVLTLWLCILCDLLSLESSPMTRYHCTTGRIISSWSTKGIDIPVLMDDLAQLDSILIECAGHHKEPSHFKHEIRVMSITNLWLVGVCSDILATQCEPIQMWKRLHQFLRFPVRLRLTEVAELEEKTAEKYFCNLDRVRNWSQSTDVEQAIIAKWLDCFVPPTIDDCSFGSGATANPAVKSMEEKYSYYSDTARTRQLARCLGIEPTAEIAVRPPHSRLIFVPKSAKIMRPIAAEDPMLMFYQQGILRRLDQLFRSTPLRKRIALHDQSRSRDLARRGSADPTSFATIDLSSASDSVRAELVEKWFARTPCAKALRLARSTHATYKDQIVSLPMFASMGSAICFPVECICFAAQCAATILSEGDLPIRSNYCVYGDDIIIETKYAEALIKRLEHNGFVVNKDKSYFTSNHSFRESCGGEYLDGVDITPLYLSRRFSTEKSARARMMSALITMANTCFARDYSLTRLRLIRVIKEWYGNTVLYSDNLDLITAIVTETEIEESSRSSAIYSPTATNYHLSTRYNRRLQRREYRAQSVVSLPTVSRKWVVGRYLCTLHKPIDLPSGCEPLGDARVTARTRLALRLTWRTAI